MNKGAGMYFHPVGDKLIPTFGKTVEMFTHKTGLEEASLYLLLDLFADDSKLPSEVKETIASFKKSETKPLQKR
jgi:NADH-quinone oxidoreductase subunit G